MTTNRTVTQRIGDTSQAFEALRDALTPQEMRTLIHTMTGLKPDEKTDVAAYASLVNASLHLARVVAANDRAAMMAAAMITQSGVSRPIVNPDGLSED